mmetsp:Transcript_14874/g.40855  ORF Transcript_14874/g.40855 Transcript_14874/m.40855 type:complete len:186 (+) Transcript_14874:75-632(+)
MGGISKIAVLACALFASRPGEGIATVADVIGESGADVSAASTAPAAVSAVGDRTAPPLETAFGGDESVQVVAHRGSLRGGVADGPSAHDTSDADAEAAPAEGAMEVVDEMWNSTEARRLMTKSVYCTCKIAVGNLYCGEMFYSLMQCNPMCAVVCHRKGHAVNGCVGRREVMWYNRLHYKYVDCV